MKRNTRKTAHDVIIGLSSAQPDAKSFRFALLPLAPSIEGRSTIKASDEKVIETALELRATLKLPFWDGALLAAADVKQLPAGVIAAAAFHQPLEGKVRWVSSSELTITGLAHLTAEATKSGGIYAVTSNVKLRNGKEKHIPMLDFHVAYSMQATRIVKKVIRLLGVSGTLLKSGKSYHFYGHGLVEQWQLMIFLGRALLFSPIIDRNWIAHQLIEQCCTLRISSRLEYGGAPTVIAEVDV